MPWMMAAAYSLDGQTSMGAASSSSSVRSIVHSAIWSSHRVMYSSSGTWNLSRRSSRPRLMNQGVYSLKWTELSVTKWPKCFITSKRTASSAG